MTNASRNEDGPLSNSFRDPSGFVFRKNGLIYRQINQSYSVTWESFIGCGLYASLVESGDLISHEVASDEKMQTPEGWLIIRPDLVGFWSYPYEWCFSQLKEAALTTLRIQEKALSYGMSMKDASAFNIQFINGRPILIDSLSFERFNPAKGWQGFRQFCMHFLAPLALMSMRDPRLAQLFTVHFDGIPLDLASSLLPLRSWFRFSTLMYVHLQAQTERRHSGKERAAPVTHTITSERVAALVKQMESAINKMDVRASSCWTDYFSTAQSQQEAHADKERLVRGYLDTVTPQKVWDFGGNIGHFSRVAAKKSSVVISFDLDPACVEVNYRKCKAEGCTNVLPLLLDLTNPSGRIGWDNGETMSLSDRGPTDLILSLALVHHLAIGKNLPLDRIAKWLSTLTNYLIIEFVPKSDPMVQRMLTHREDIFPDYDQNSFESIFSQYFRIIRSDKISGSGRLLHLMKAMGENRSVRTDCSNIIAN